VLWDLAKHVPIGHPPRPQLGYGLSVSVAFSPDGTVLHQLTATAGAPSDLPTALAFSPDGNTLATAGSSGKVRLWDPHTGAARGAGWTAGGGAVLSTSFSPDGSALATSGSDGTAALWDISSGKQIGAPLTGSSGATMAAFDPTGHTLATASEDGTVLLWDVDPASWRARACAVAGRRLTPARVAGIPPAPGLPALLLGPVARSDLPTIIVQHAQRVIITAFPCPLLAAGWPPPGPRPPSCGCCAATRSSRPSRPPDRHRRPPRARAGPPFILLRS
jgi:hypothetical protein